MKDKIICFFLFTILLFLPFFNQFTFILSQNNEIKNNLRCSDDSYEDNNYIYDATQTEGGYYQNLKCFDNDYFEVDLDAGYQLNVEINFTNSKGNLDLELHDPFSLISGSYSFNDSEKLTYMSEYSTDIFIRIFYVDNPNDYSLNISVSFGPTVRSITVTNPSDENIVWDVNTTYEITWIGSPLISEVDIYLEFDSISLTRWITTGTENNGSYPWKVPYDLPPGDRYRLRIRDTYDGEEYDYSSFFTINNTGVPPVYLNLIEPSWETVWYNGSTCEIQWESSSGFDRVDVLIFNDFLSVAQYIVEDTENDGSYAWTVPDSFETSDSYYIYLIGVGAGTLDISDYFCIINTESTDKLIYVTHPGYPDSLTVGTQHEIRWHSSGTITNVSISYEVDRVEYEIENNILNTGSYLWTIPLSIRSSPECKILIREVGSSISGESRMFTIVNPDKPLITITDPDWHVTWYYGSSYDITWTTLGDVALVNLSLSNQYGHVCTIASNVLNQGNYSWTIPNTLTGGRYYITVFDSSNSTIKDTTSYIDIIYEETPLYDISMINPGISAIWYVENTYDITWNSTNNFEYVTIELYDRSEGYLDTIAEEVPNNGSYAWTIPITFETNHEHYFLIYNSGNFTPYDTSAIFSIVNNFSITVLNPIAGAEWAKGNTYEIRWSTNGSISNVGIALVHGPYIDLWITTSTENNGSYMWTIPYSINEREDYNIVVYHPDSTLLNGWSGDFSIVDVLLSSITVISPNSDSEWIIGTTHEITWISTGAITNVEILLVNDSTTTTIVDSTENDGSFTWNIPDSILVYDNYRMLIRDIDEPGIYDTSEAFSISRSKASPSSIPGHDTIFFALAMFASILGLVILNRDKKIR
ncbi:MAG: Ser-Thr-rich GPI-anchored membrane family protein [Promethearchaeota archaeon]